MHPDTSAFTLMWIRASVFTDIALEGRRIFQAAASGANLAGSSLSMRPPQWFGQRPESMRPRQTWIGTAPNSIHASSTQVLRIRAEANGNLTARLMLYIYTGVGPKPRPE